MPRNDDLTDVRAPDLARRDTPPNKAPSAPSVPWSEQTVTKMEDTMLAPVRALDELVGMKLGEYVVEGRIAKGGMGAVYRGVHPAIGKPVAIKVLLPHVANDPSAVQRLVAEARAVNSIRHPNIVDIFSLGELSDGRHYLVMELLDGEPLNVLLHRRGTLTVLETLTVLDQAFSALDAAHTAGVIHRDLKPANIFVTPLPDGTWRIKIVDFGIAKIQGTPAATAPDKVVGTPGFMSPEQLVGDPPTASFDLYAMGAVAYTLLSGKEPFASPSVQEVIDGHLHKKPTPLSKHVDELPPMVESLVMTLLEKKPSARFQSAKEAREEVKRIRRELASSKTDIREVPRPPPPPPPEMTADIRRPVSGPSFNAAVGPGGPSTQSDVTPVNQVQRFWNEHGLTVLLIGITVVLLAILIVLLFE